MFAKCFDGKKAKNSDSKGIKKQPCCPKPCPKKPPCPQKPPCCPRRPPPAARQPTPENKPKCPKPCCPKPKPPRPKPVCPPKPQPCCPPPPPKPCPCPPKPDCVRKSKLMGTKKVNNRKIKPKPNKAKNAGSLPPRNMAPRPTKKPTPMPRFRAPLRPGSKFVYYSKIPYKSHNNDNSK